LQILLKFKSDPRGIGAAFHGAGAGIVQKGTFFKGLKMKGAKLSDCRGCRIYKEDVVPL